MNHVLTEPEIADIQTILMRQLDVTREQVTEEASIMGDLGADSLDVVEIGMNLEERFDMTIPDDEWERVKTVGALYTAVSECQTRGHKAG